MCVLKISPFKIVQIKNKGLSFEGRSVNTGGEIAHVGPVLFQTRLITEWLLCGVFKGEMECSVTAEGVPLAARPLTCGLGGDFSVGNAFFDQF